MKQMILSVILLICSFAHGQIDQELNDSLTIMTFNCEFMWDGYEPEEGQVQFSRKGDPELAGVHMAEIAEMVIRNNPDVINLVEVEGIEAVNRLNDEYLKGQKYNIYFIKGKDSYTGQDVALLSRIDIEDIQYYSGKGISGTIEKSVSKNYFATCAIGDLKLAFIGLHFLSVPTDTRKIDQRQAQADAIRDIAIKLNDQGYSLIVMGDYNDFDGDSSCLDLNDNLPVTTVLKIVKEMDPSDGGDNLLNVAEIISKEQRYTAHYDKNRNNNVDFPQEMSSIDHILISETLRSRLGYVAIDHTHDPTELSDHYPIIIRIGIR